MESGATTAFDHTLPGVDQRVSTIEKERAAEAERARLSEAATKEDIEQLNDRFNALIKAVWGVAGLLATVGGTILANHL
jgi:hypothetical protein